MKRVSNHLIPPLINNASKILILGSFPSVKSMEKGFYYMHSQNRFYQVLDAIFDENMYQGSIELKKETLLQLRIALYKIRRFFTKHLLRLKVIKPLLKKGGENQ